MTNVGKVFVGKEFTVTNDHIKLIEKFNVGNWDNSEFGAPTIDPKRPYGNSDVVGDVCDILGWENSEEIYLYTKVHDLHRELETVMQILISNARHGLKQGLYVRHNNYTPNWVYNCTIEEAEFHRSNDEQCEYYKKSEE